MIWWRRAKTPFQWRWWCLLLVQMVQACKPLMDSKRQRARSQKKMLTCRIPRHLLFRISSSGCFKLLCRLNLCSLNDVSSVNHILSYLFPICSLWKRRRPLHSKNGTHQLSCWSKLSWRKCLRGVLSFVFSKKVQTKRLLFLLKYSKHHFAKECSILKRLLQTRLAWNWTCHFQAYKW